MDNNKKGTLLDTNVDIQPSGVFFNVTNDTIENSSKAIIDIIKSVSN